MKNCEYCKQSTSGICLKHKAKKKITNEMIYQKLEEILSKVKQYGYGSEGGGGF